MSFLIISPHGRGLASANCNKTSKLYWVILDPVACLTGLSIDRGTYAQSHRHARSNTVLLHMSAADGWNNSRILEKSDSVIQWPWPISALIEATWGLHSWVHFCSRQKKSGEQDGLQANKLMWQEIESSGYTVNRAQLTLKEGIKIGWFLLRSAKLEWPSPGLLVDCEVCDARQ